MVSQLRWLIACYVRRPLRSDSLVGGQGECMDADAKVSRRIMSGLAATKARGVVQRTMPARVRMVCSLVALLGAAAHSHVAMAEHREPCDSGGSCTVLGAPGGESPPGDSTFFTLDPPSTRLLSVCCSFNSGRQCDETAPTLRAKAALGGQLSAPPLRR